MMGSFQLSQTVTATRGRLVGDDCAFDAVSTDTRSLAAGDLFVALRGDNFDAHDFLTLAREKNACGLVVEDENASIKLPQLVVGDTTKALGDLARFNRRAFAGPVVGITGSSGKTTVKTMLKNILTECGETLATRGNLNNHIGVPLTLFELSAQHQYAVIEMGASGPDEISYLSSIAEPDVAVITNALPAHVAGFGSLEGVVRAKGEIYSSLKTDGVAVLNADDDAAPHWKSLIGDKRLLTFSVAGAQADITAADIQMAADGRTTFQLQLPAKTLPVETLSVQTLPVSLQLLGRQNIANALAAATCACAIGVDAAAIKRGLESTRAVPGRMNILTGRHRATVIDDSYNANPGSVRAAIDVLANWQGETVLVLGELAELGPESKSLHRSLGEYAQRNNIGRLMTIGRDAATASQGFGPGAKHFDSKSELIKKLQLLMDKRTLVLVKGSRTAKMEEVVTAITKEEP